MISCMMNIFSAHTAKITLKNASSACYQLIHNFTVCNLRYSLQVPDFFG